MIMSEKVVHLGGGIMSPRKMLMDLADQADEFQDVLVIIRHKDDSVDKYATSINHWWLFACASIVQELALKALHGEIIDE